MNYKFNTNLISKPPKPRGDRPKQFSVVCGKSKRS